jgi:hypothetical protein
MLKIPKHIWCVTIPACNVSKSLDWTEVSVVKIAAHLFLCLYVSQSLKSPRYAAPHLFCHVGMPVHST